MIEKIRDLVAELMSDNSNGHGNDHMERVCRLALAFAKNEGADENIVALAALLHDVDDYKIVGIEKADSLTNAKEIMKKANISNDIQDRVLGIISTMGYSKLLKGIRPTSIEGAIVSDADMCDAIGATGIIRTYTYSVKNGRPFFDKNIFPTEDMSADKYTRKCADSSVCHIFEKILKLKDLMLTESGKQEAIERHKFVIEFLRHVFNEENSLEWIEYLDNYLEEQKASEGIKR